MYLYLINVHYFNHIQYAFFITVKSVRMLLKTTDIPRILYCIILMLCVTMMVFTSICVDDTVYILVFCEAAFDELEFIMCLSLKHLCFCGYQYAIKVKTNFSNVVY